MWVNINDLTAKLERSYRKYEEELRGEKDMNYRRTLYGILVGYRNVEIMIDELAEDYRKQGLEHIEVRGGTD